MSLLQRHLYPFGDDRAGVVEQRGVALFLVTSWGHSGSIWLAGSLNLHDGVCATVGIDNPIEAFTLYPINKDAAAITAEAGDALSAFGFGDRDRPRFAPFRAALRARGLDLPVRDRARLPAYLFDELELIPGAYAARGNVHGVTLSQMRAMTLADPGLLKGRPVVVLDLIRHPIGRTESAINATLTYHMDALAERVAAWIGANGAESLALERRYGIDVSDPRVQAVLHVHRQGLQNEVWAQEIRAFPDAHRILLERLQDDRDYFAHVFFLITQGRLCADTAYLDRVFDATNLGSGRQSTAQVTRPLGPREQYEQWSPFERAEFEAACRRIEAADVYFPFGYDFSFVAA